MASSAITGPVLSDVRRAPAGTAAAPSFAFNDSTGTGVYLVSPGVLGLSTAGVQRVVVDASGNVGIGTASPAAAAGKVVHVKSATQAELCLDNTDKTGGIKWHIASGSNAVINSGFLAVYDATNSVERLRINHAGKLKVGNSAAYEADTASLVFLTQTNDTAASLNVENRSTNFSGETVIIGNHRNTSNGTYKFLTCVRQGFAYALYIYDSGTVANGTGVYGGISDEKVKENIVDATPKLDKLKQVRIVNYTLKNDPEKTKMLGVVAQEVEQIFPGLIQEDADKDSEGNDLGTTTKSVKYSIFVPMLIKAMQEQQEIIEKQSQTLEKLEARLSALESK